ncbi:unnamed protein product, partial [Dibothriocephalus latus]
MLGSSIHERQLAGRQGDELSKVAAHTYETDHEFNFAAVNVLAHAGNKMSKEFMEVLSTDENSVNRCVELAPA